jgi:hypothetical protein
MSSVGRIGVVGGAGTGTAASIVIDEERRL